MFPNPILLMSNELTPDKIMQLGIGFWSSKTLFSAIELGLFTELAKGPQDTESLRTRLELHPRSARVARTPRAPQAGAER